MARTLERRLKLLPSAPAIAAAPTVALADPPPQLTFAKGSPPHRLPYACHHQRCRRYVCERIEQDEIKRQVFASLTDDARARVCDLVEGVEPKWPNESKGAQLPSTSTTEASVPPPSGDFE
jgi:hypothetical protein